MNAGLPERLARDIRAIALNNEVFKSGMGGILSNEEVAFERASANCSAASSR